MAKCEICGKGPMFGHNVSHSKRHTKRRWNPNIQKTRVATGRGVKRLKLCTRCIRTQHKLSV